MVGTAIHGMDTASGMELGKTTGFQKSGGENFQKIMSKSLSANVNSSTSRDVMKNNGFQKDTKSNASDSVKKSSQQENNTAVQEDKKVTQTNTDNNPKEVSAADEKLSEAAEKIKDLLKEKFGVSDDELEKAMAELGLGMLDLLKGTNLTDLVVNITGVQDAVAIITDSELSESLKDVLTYLEQLLSDVNAGRDLTEAPQMNLGQPEDNGAVVEEFADDVAVKEAVQEKQPEDTVPEEHADMLEQVLKGKLTVENNTGNTADTGKHQDKPTQANAGNSTSVAGNLMQTIQEAFSSTAANEVTQVNPADVIRQIVEAVKVTQKQSMQSIEVQLNPESLGKIHLTVSARNGVITAEIVTQNEQVKRVVESQMSMLKENLESQGIKVDAVEITVQSHAFEGGQNLQGNDSQQEKAAKEGKKHLNLDSLSDLLEEDLTEEETAARNAVMSENSSVEYTA